MPIARDTSSFFLNNRTAKSAAAATHHTIVVGSCLRLKNAAIPIAKNTGSQGNKAPCCERIKPEMMVEMRDTCPYPDGQLDRRQIYPFLVSER